MNIYTFENKYFVGLLFVGLAKFILVSVLQEAVYTITTLYSFNVLSQLIYLDYRFEELDYRLMISRVRIRNILQQKGIVVTIVCWRTLQV